VDTILETYRGWHWLLIEGRLILLIAFVTGEFVAVKMFKMCVEDQEAKLAGGKVRTYPALYFAVVSAQITPLLITGMVERDYLIVTTRASMFLAAMWSWAVVRSKAGYIPWRRARLWLYPIAFILSTFIWAWVEYPSVSQFFSDHRQVLSLIFGWVSVGMMGILVIIDCAVDLAGSSAGSLLTARIPAAVASRGQLRLAITALFGGWWAGVSDLSRERNRAFRIDESAVPAPARPDGPVAATALDVPVAAHWPPQGKRCSAVNGSP
jgi:hypothetical protein